MTIPLLLYGRKGKKAYSTDATNRPILGPQLLGNSGFEIAGAGAPDVFDSWTETLAGTSTINDDVVDFHAGAHSCRLDIDASNSNSRISQSIVNNLGDFIFFDYWVKGTAGKSLNVHETTNVGITRVPGTTWTNYRDVLRSTLANTPITCRRNNATSGSIWWDDVLVYVLNLPSCLSAIRPGSSNFTASCAIYLPAPIGTIAGMMLCLDDPNNPQNCLLAYTNGVNGLLLKRIAGTWTGLINTGITFTGGSLFQVIKNGLSVSLWYKGAQVGTTQSLVAGTDDKVINGTTHALFRTYTNDRVINFSVV